VKVGNGAALPLTLTSIGTTPLTISSATITGAGFALQASTFPATLNSGNSITLGLEFDPTVAGTATGQVVIQSNSSTGGTTTIGLSGTATAATTVLAVAVTPTSASTITEATQQFAASVSGTSNTGVTWSVSGSGCGGSACGTISSSGLYTSPAAVPSPAAVTVTATSASDPTKTATAAVTIEVAQGKAYYLAPAANGGNDSNNGLSAGAPWLSPNHSLNCGDVILATASTSYDSANFTTGTWGVVNCPAGNNVAWLKCVTFDACKIVSSSTGTAAMWVDRSYWGVQGWEATTVPGATYAGCFTASPNYNTPVEIHHIIFANNIANGCQASGFVSANQGSIAGVDYLAIIGNIAYNASQGSAECFSGISIYQPIQSDTLPGTHLYVGGNFSFGNYDPSVCAGGTPTDGEGIIFDTFDNRLGGSPTPYAAQALADNNILVGNGGRGMVVADNNYGTAPHSNIYIRHNTISGNNLSTDQNATGCGELELNMTTLTQATYNLVTTKNATGCGTNPIFALAVSSSDGTVQMNNNFAYSPSGNNTTIWDSGTFSYGSSNILGINPGFSNPTIPGAPNCVTASSVPNCMASLVSNFKPTASAAAGYGYQIPSPSSTYDQLFPQWLCNVNLPEGLVTMGCKATP
jgi:hypothetical protein